MPKISDRPMRRVCVRLWDEDCEALESYATLERKFNALLRDIVHTFVLHAGARLRQKIDELEAEEKTNFTKLVEKEQLSFEKLIEETKL